MKPETRGVLKVRRILNGKVGWVSTSAFLTTLGLRHETRSWPIVFAEKERALMVGNDPRRYDSAEDDVIVHPEDYEILEDE